MDLSKMMEIDPPLNFPTKDDEVKYWMNTAHEMYQRNEATMRELQEYQENSQYLEKELESSYWESDKRNRYLSHENLKLVSNNEELKVKLSQQIAAYSVLQNQMQEIRKNNIELINNIRNLEQKNDDLERDNRALKMMEKDMECQYNDAIEKIALLETDLLEENYVQFDMKRLQSENEDLKQQIENIRIESRNNYLNDRPCMEIKEVQSPTHHRSAYNLACATFALFKKNQRESEAKGNINFSEDNLASSSPVKRAKETPRINVQAAYKEKYNTEGRGLSQAFARYNKQQEDKERNSLNRSIEIRTKKIKDEEKRQRSLSSFVKRIRAARNQLLRRNE